MTTPVYNTCVFLLLYWIKYVYSDSTWTFNNPGISYIAFTPQYTTGQNQHIQLNFRTRQSNGLLFHHYFLPYNKLDYPLLSHYEMFAEIRQGYLRVGHQVNQYSQTLTLPQGIILNDDKWHSLSWHLDSTDGVMSVKLDNQTAELTLEVFQWGRGRQILQWSKLPSFISFGSTNASGSQEFFNYVGYHFVGCLSNLKYSREDELLINVPIEKISGVTQGCGDRCVNNDPCLNGGRCINMYTRTKCDCYGTNYEGKHCEHKGSTTMTFRGYEWILYKLYHKKEDRLFSDKNKISLEFKTGRGSGILLYAVGSSPYHTHVTASIHGGKLHTSISFGDKSTDLDFTMGLQLDNNRWHNLTIIHEKRNIMVFLDGVFEVKPVTSDQYFLSLDPNVYFGGGHNFVETRGLQITQSFVGCLRNVYFNEESVLYNLKSGRNNTEYQGGRSTQYGCDTVQEIPITFPMAGSMLQWDVKQDKILSVAFRFRTVRDTAILFSVELLAQDGVGGYEYGYLEVWLKDGQPYLDFVPSTKNQDNFRENQSIPSLVNNSQWHSLSLTLRSSQAKLKVDQVSIRTKVYRKTLEHRGTLVFGYGLRTYKRSEGYVGCIEGLVVQGKKVDPISILESESSVGLILDGCNLIDYCHNNNICQHDSLCLSDWNGVQCDCSEHYEGKACHFAKYPRTCNEYYQSGRNTSGVYMVDMDGKGPLEPAYVQCEMGRVHLGNEYGETVIEHNLKANTTIRKDSFADRQYHIAYRGMTTSQLSALTKDSAHCEQYIKYECQKSPLKLGKKTWFKAANGEIVDYIGSNRAGFCNCPPESMCRGQRCYCDHSKSRFCNCPPESMCRGQRCYCDHKSETWNEDSGINNNKDQLPITEVTVLQYLHGNSDLTIGPLRCWGSAHVPLEKSITFIKSSSYVMLHSWKKGDLRINIKTDQTNALVLYQTPGKGSGNKFSVKIISANEIQFYFYVKGKTILKTVYTSKSLDTGDWYTIVVEFDQFNLRLAVDQSRVLYTLPTDIDRLIDFSDGILYIGGLPEGLASEMGETSPGLTGCVRGFVYNDQEKDLTRLVDSSMTGVTTDCMSSCWPNPCQNRGVCEEKWGTYNCVCANKWIHYGKNCERDINRDAVTLAGTETSFLTFDSSEYPAVLDETLILSFRTFERETLLLYIHDHMTNFIQLELHRGVNIVISYNNFNSVVKKTLTFDPQERLNDGKWKQVIVEEVDGFTKFQVEGQSVLIQFSRLKLSNYAAFPYKDSIIKESVFLSRPSKQPLPFVHLYVGGVPKGATTLPNFKGCLRGFKIGKRIFDLIEKGLKSKEGDVTGVCETGCIANRCLNGGYCTEYFKHGEYSCDCSESDFSGKQCQIEPSAKFAGSSVIEHRFRLSSVSQRSVSERLMFTFISDGLPADEFVPGERIDMAMVFVRSSTHNDYILVKMEQDGSVVIETNQGLGIYRMRVDRNFANGKAHELHYRRDGSDMYISLDGIQEATMNYAAFDLDDIDTIHVGGMMMEDDRFYDIVNFTGCISNVVYTPSKSTSERLRTLKDYYTENTDIVVKGDNITNCSDKKLTVDRAIKNTPVPLPDEITDYEMVTMPDWDVGSAKVEIIGGLPIPPTDVITTTQSLIIPGNSSLTLIQDHGVDNLTIVIVASIIALFLILAIIIALLLIKRRKKLGDYEMKKQMVMENDVDVKVPLNHVTSTPVPADHLAKLDEFSMVSATLGPRMRNNVTTDGTNRYSHSSIPMIDDETGFTNQIYNKRKNRPASSISEVLEELERRQKHIKDPSSDEISKELEELLKKDLEINRGHGEGELEWDPQVDKAPLTYGEITFFNAPLLLSIPHELEEFEMSANSSIHSLEKKEEDLITEGSENQTSNGDYNGDSGYEAESRPEGLESTGDTATPDTTIDDSPTQMYMYDISGIVDLQDSPNLSVHQKLLQTESGV